MVGAVQSSGGNLHCCMTYMTTMRAQPSNSFSNLVITDRFSADYDVSSVGNFIADVSSLYVRFTNSSLSAQGNNECWLIVVKSGNDGYFELDAEL